jgi:hydroxymethylbilane synthase
VAELLRRASPGLDVSLLELSTEGDRFLQAPLSQIGGKGLFVKEIEEALLDGRADLAVHSLKDMTSALPASLCLACVPEREDPRDAFVSPRGLALAALPKDAQVGTSSLRRGCQLLEKRPDLKIVSLRGNVQTRLRKTEEQNLAGTMLAYAGLKRLGLDGKVTEVVEPEVSLPAVGQGVLAIESRTDDAGLRELLAKLEHGPTRLAVAAERAFLEKLEGGCSVPLAGYATLEGGGLRLRGLIGKPDGSRVLRGEVKGASSDGAKLGRALAEELLGQGGGEILRGFARPPSPAET